MQMASMVLRTNSYKYVSLFVFDTNSFPSDTPYDATCQVLSACYCVLRISCTLCDFLLELQLLAISYKKQSSQLYNFWLSLKLFLGGNKNAKL